MMISMTTCNKKVNDRKFNVWWLDTTLTSGGVQELNLVLSSVTVKVPTGVTSSATSRPCSKTPLKVMPGVVLLTVTVIRKTILFDCMV